MGARGFSLIETLIVAVVAGIILAFCLPAFGTYRTALLEAQAREQLVQDLRSARQLAVTRHSPVVVGFGDGVATTGLTQYTTHLDLNGDRQVQPNESHKLHTLPPGTRIALCALAPNDSLIFDISGVLWPSTAGGMLVIDSARSPDTLLVSAAGMVYRP